MNIIAIFILVSIVVSIYEKRDTYKNFISGIKNGGLTFLKIVPTVFAMLIISLLLSDLFSSIKVSNIFPLNLLPLILIRPFSGAASIGILLNIINNYGVDSREGILACIILGGSETTLYAINMYYGSTKIKPKVDLYIAAFIADIVLYIVAFLITSYII